MCIRDSIGDAQELAKWHKMTVDANIDVIKARRRVSTLEPEWRFAMPTALEFDAEKGRLLVADTQRGRIQIYEKLNDYLDPQFNLLEVLGLQALQETYDCLLDRFMLSWQERLRSCESCLEFTDRITQDEVDASENYPSSDERVYQNVESERLK